MTHHSPAPPRHVALVAHAFPPDGHAGVEQYTARLGRRIQALGVRVSVVCARVRQGEAQNAVLRENVGGLEVFGLVQNWPYRDLPEAATDGALDRVFDGLLGQLEPDLVAIQSLQGLSWGFPAVAARRGIDVVMHLHDAFASCASGGQRLHPDGTLCLPVDKRRCGACFDRFRHREGPIERASRWAAARLPGPVPPDALHRAFGALPSGLQDGIRQLNERGAKLALARRTGDERGLRNERAPGDEPVDERIAARDEVVREALRSVRRVISPSSFLAESVSGDGVELPDVQVVPTGVPGTRVAARAGEGLRVLFLGTWVQHKGAHVLAEALASLSPEDAGRIAATAHGPAPFPAYRERCRDAANGRLTIGDPLPPDDVPGVVAAHDVVVVPSVWAENAPLVALEARALGRPVIASDLGGLIELVHEGVDGLRFAPGDPAALAAALRRLLHEDGLLERLSSAVRPPPSEEAWASAILRAWTLS